MIYKHLLRCILLIFIVAPATAQQKTTLRVVQTTDVHGVLFPFDYINNTAIDYGMAHVYTYVKKLRKNTEEEVILLDNGDLLQGQPTVYYANFVDTTGQHLVSKVMNYMQYDAATVGNHDIEAGPRVYNQLINDFKHPWLSANIIDTRTSKPYFKPYTVIERNNVRIAILGLTTPGVTKWLSPNLWPNMKFIDMIESAKMWMDTIQSKEKPHVIIGLFHSGHDATYEGADPTKPFNDNASILVAEQVPGFDAILIGHDHDRLLTKVANINGDSVLIADPGARARLVSDITIKVDLDSSFNLISKRVEGRIVSMQGLMPDPEYVSNFSSFNRGVEEFVDRRIGVFTAPVSSRDAYFGPSAFVNLIHSAQLGISNSEVSFAAPLSFDTSIDQGNVYVRDLFKLYSYENLLYIMNLTGKEIKDYLEYSYGLWLNTMTSSEDNLLLFRTNGSNKPVLHNRGRAILKSSFYNFDSASGINYLVDVTKPAGSRITISSMANGTPFDYERVYKVAINSYRGAGGGGHLTEGVGLSKEEMRKRIVNMSTYDMRYYLMKWIERTGRITPTSSQNWQIMPTDWVEKAIVKDRYLLFGEEVK
jgi:2',3'-cyclic-nucleotide 2'-phosphodiesterase / 3'-nucleotidase